MARTKRPGLRKLIAMCPHMRRVHALAGSPPPRGLEPGFATILRIIVDQQVSTQSGAAIWRKLEETLGPISPPVILRADEEGLRGCGFSGPKARYGMALATAVTDGTLDLGKLPRMSNARVEETLIQIKGIGRWTAEIYLMFALGRTDIWPAGDLAVAEAAGQLLDLPTRPTIPEMDEIGEQWRPWRSTAAVMLWHYYHHIRSRPGGRPGG
ncbi:MAG: DNA-3-methyladenine glycosylase 2 family protein [Rhodospirillales bacterium]|jgi:DNA-3-methyladenine glycosylase II|nr:DNA-3-methyladenine glycosylase 2 family protein [Rhodospirillales bacterium]MBT4039161.1 DNA-3-methyladenine glycosylase 2 family protein [Rhodospirillales bacterium]MBT4628307.1 DNA-3-methyladenine glycosylase 2 family protein [Rhodospirillales bacterium]MBT5352321.1 DNA-3-methyladenine glycosylase 2 family protein [Rhodospirillales bacterium]MBT5520967.1 DNA-3-methyladenine glycosylase 2 family protein [Rhodospirillales bacterium]